MLNNETKETQAQSTAAEAKPVTRKKSPETVLKQRMRTIERELAAIAKASEAFKKLQKEEESAVSNKTKLEAELVTVKAKLIKELGLD